MKVIIELAVDERKVGYFFFNTFLFLYVRVRVRFYRAIY